MKIIFSTVLVIFCNIAVYSQQGATLCSPYIDNIGYLIKMGCLSPKEGVVSLAPRARNTGSSISSSWVSLVNSPDVLINNIPDITQSENSVSVNINQVSKALNSNNSITVPDYQILGASSFTTTNQGLNWSGNVATAAGLGDPAAAISNDGRYYIGFIDNNFGQSVAVSVDEGNTWQINTVASGSSGLLDKNHLWVDKSLLSPYVGALYSGWTPFIDPANPNNKRIIFSRSTNGGLTWSSGINISSGSFGSLHQGVNINSGPNGEVYAVYAIYDPPPNVNKPPEVGIGFSKSFDGGISFSTPQDIVTNIKGIRFSDIGKNLIRVNSFPSMAVDNSFGPNRGVIYVVWANWGVPGINTGNDIDVYLIKSANGGASWSTPTKVNTSVPNQGKKHFFPWITCDPSTGKLHVVYYDDRNTASTDCEVWVSSSFDGGVTWDDYKVSDVSFTPVGINGSSYFGDYLGISANDDIIYPIWTDNRSGIARSYTSPLISSDFCPGSLTIQNITLPVVATYKYRAANTISVAGSSTSFVMQGNGTTGARASMIADGSITLSPNTSIEKGAVLTIVPGPCSSPILRPGIVSGEFSKLNIQPKEFEVNSQINIYPNPVKGMIYIELSKELQNKHNLSYVLTNLMGAVIIKGLITNNLSAVNVNQLPPGGYFISVYENEKLIETKKLIKN